MELAKVSLSLLTQRINALLPRPKPYTEQYISAVRGGKEGSAALRKVVRDEITAMLTEAAEAAKSQPA